MAAELERAEKALVTAISNLVRANLSDEGDAINRTAELVSAVKQLTILATRQVEGSAGRGSPSSPSDHELQMRKEYLQSTLKHIVSDIKADLGQPLNNKRPRGELLAQLKNLATVCKDMIDSAHSGISSPVNSTHTRVIDDEDRVPSPNNDRKARYNAFQATDWQSETASPQICRVCQKRIGESEDSLTFSNDFWHLTCFKCSTCQRVMEPKEQFMLNNHNDLICNNCAPKCKACSQSIVGESIFALGFAYHLSCFRCFNCMRLIGDAGKFYPKQNEPLCGVCIARESVFNKRWSPGAADETEDSDDLSAKLSETVFSIPSELPMSSSMASPSSSTTTGTRRDSSSEPSSPAQASSPSAGPTLQSANGQKPRANVPVPSVNYVSKPLSAIPPEKRASLTGRDGLQQRRQSFQNRPLPPRPKSRHANNPRCLEGVLSSDIGIDYLVEFCMEDFSVEKISFWLDVEQFKIVDVGGKEEDLYMYATNIHHKYIQSGAEMELNLPPAIKARADTLPQLVSVPRNFFNEAQSWVFDDMEKEVFPRFFYSSSGKKYLGLMSELGPARSAKVTTPSPLRNQTSAGSLSTSPPGSGGSLTTAMRARTKSDNTIDLDVGERIISIEVTNFEKRFDGEKYYVYEIKVIRNPRPGGTEDTQPEFPDDLFIYRRYSEFFDLHNNLIREFADAVFPPFPPKIYIGRSHIKSVSKVRLQNLDYYMKGLLQMNEQIGKHAILRAFLHPTDDDQANYWFNKRLSQASNNFRLKYH